MAQPSMEDTEAINSMSGLPERIRNELETSLGSRFIKFFSNWLYLLVVLAGFLIGASIWRRLDDLTLQNSEQFATTVPTIWIDTSFGFSMLIALFTWIFAAGLIVALIIRIVPMPQKAALFFGTRKEIKWAFQDFTSLWSGSSGLQRPVDAGDGINRSLEQYIKRSSARILPFVILIFALSWLETRHFNIIAENGLYDGNFFSGELKLKPWTDAELVLLGCNQTDSGGKLIYEVVFKDGSKKRIPAINHFNDKHWLVNLETMDAHLVTAGTQFKRWKWLKRDPLDRQCLRGFYGELGPTHKDRFDKLLRVGQFPEDTYPRL